MAGENVVTLTDANFAAETKKGVVLVDAWAPWCGPCRMLGPVVEALADEMKGKVKVGKLNVDENSDSAEKLEVSSIPALFLFRDGKVVANRVGAATKESLKEWLNSNL